MFSHAPIIRDRKKPPWDSFSSTQPAEALQVTAPARKVGSSRDWQIGIRQATNGQFVFRRLHTDTYCSMCWGVLLQYAVSKHVCSLPVRRCCIAGARWRSRRVCNDNNILPLLCLSSNPQSHFDNQWSHSGKRTSIRDAHCCRRISSRSM